MTTALFNNWVKKLDEKIKIMKKKIILFLDNFSGHNTSDLKLENIRIEYNPPNCTSMVQLHLQLTNLWSCGRLNNKSKN